MRKKVKSKIPMDTPGLYAVVYEDNSIGYEFINDGKSGEPTTAIEPKDLEVSLVRPDIIYQSKKKKDDEEEDIKDAPKGGGF